MHDVELTSAHTLRRRRLVGVGMLAALVLASLAMGNSLFTPIWTLFDGDGAQRTYLVGDPFDEWVYVVCDGEQQQITVSQDGRLAGAAALGTLRRERFQDTCDLPKVDSPDLANWQAQMTRLQALTQAPGSSATEILDAARKMPVSVLYLRPLSEWIRGDSLKAAEFLDAVAREPMRFDDWNPIIVRTRQNNFAKLIGTALDQAASHDIAPDRLETWLRSDQIVGSEQALRKLAGVPGASNRALSATLERLDTIPTEQRGELFSAVASRLVHDGQYAALLSKQLDLLPRETRFVAARALLAQPDASTQFPIALLADFRQFHGADSQLDLFTKVADKLKNETEAPLLLTMHLKDLADMQRRMAATYLLSLDEAGETAFSLAVLRSFAELHPISRPKVVYAVMQSPQFHDRAVQEACLLAIRLQTQGAEQQELLGAMLRHRDLANDLQPEIGADLG